MDRVAAIARSGACGGSSKQLTLDFSARVAYRARDVQLGHVAPTR